MSWFPNTLSKSFLSDPPIFAWLSLFSYRVLSSLFFSLSLSLSLSLSPPPSHTQKSASQPPATGGLQVAVQSGGIACSASTLALFYQRACSLHRSLNLYSLTARPRRCLFFFSLLSSLFFLGIPFSIISPSKPSDFVGFCSNVWFSTQRKIRVLDTCAPSPSSDEKGNKYNAISAQKEEKRDGQNPETLSLQFFIFSFQVLGKRQI